MSHCRGCGLFGTDAADKEKSVSDAACRLVCRGLGWGLEVLIRPSGPPWAFLGRAQRQAGCI